MKQRLVISTLLIVTVIVIGIAQQRVNVSQITAPATGTQVAASSDSIVCATDTGCVIKAASGNIASGALASGSIASGALASGALASGSIASGALASGSFAAGSLNSAIPDPCLYTAKTFAAIDIVTATTTVIIDQSASNNTYICGMVLFTDAANDVALVDDATNNCTTPDAGLMGGLTAAEGFNFGATQGVAFGNGLSTIAKTAGTNRDVCLITSANTQLNGVVSYVQVP